MHRWLLVVSSCVLISGCAFGLTGPDPDRPRSQMPKCDTGKGLVVLDGAMAATAGVIAISLAGETEPAVALLPLSLGAIYVAGAVRGNSNVNKCRKAMGEWESYMAARETMPPPTEREPLPAPPRRRPPQGVPPQPAQVEPEETAAVAPAPSPAPAPAPVAAAPAPAQPQPQPRAKAPPPKPAQPPPPQDDEWADFWREVE